MTKPFGPLQHRHSLINVLFHFYFGGCRTVHFTYYTDIYPT